MKHVTFIDFYCMNGERGRFWLGESGLVRTSKKGSGTPVLSFQSISPPVLAVIVQCQYVSKVEGLLIYTYMYVRIELIAYSFKFSI